MPFSYDIVFSMNVVFLSPQFPSNFYRFCVAARANGLNILGISDVPFASLHHELKDALIWYYQVSDMHNYAELCEAMKFFTEKYGQIDRLDSHNEYWLETEAKLRTEFNIPGIKNDTISLIRRKSKMKDVFKKAKVPCAPGIIVKSKAAVLDFIDDLGFPVIAKPDSGVGAANTYKIANKAELDAFLKEKPDVDYYMEAFINGKMFTFDGLTDKNADMVFYTSHTYSQGIMETVNDDLDVYYYSLREVPEDLRELGARLVKAFDVRERFFHFEFFRTSDGKLKALEVNIRPPGGLTTDMFNFACDMDVYDLWAKVLKFGTLPSFTYERKYHCCYVCRKNNKRYVHSQDEVVSKLGSALVHHEPISSIFGRALGDYGYLVRSEDLAEVVRMAEFIQKK